MSATPLDDLRTEIADGQVLVVVGTGVSVAATGGAPVASWVGLLEDGVAYCESLLGASLPAGWAQRRRAQLASGDTEELIGAAEDLTRRLGGPDGGEFRRWLEGSVGRLEATSPAVLEALAELGVPLATTNYDGLLEAATGRPVVTWRQGALVEQAVRGDKKAILHLHGYWQEPTSVVLGIRSYDAVLGDAHAEAMRKALASTRTLVFVGCGTGLSDPNFGELRRWLAGVFTGSPYRHYRLCLEKEVADLWDEHGLGERIIPLPYGRGYNDLAAFLRGLAPPRTTTRPARAATSTPARHLPPPPRCLGRDTLVEELVTALLTEPPPPIPVLGPGGIGKSTICLAALHESRVAQRYHDRRYFVRCSAATTGEAVLAEVAATLGLPISPDLAAQTLTYLGQEPSALALANAETPWWADPEGTEGQEGIFARLARVPGLALVVSLRGRQRPFGLAWRDPIDVPPLPTPELRKVFLAVAGQSFDGDPHLDELVAAQDGLPLTTTLLAYLAEGEPSLAGLWRQWTQRRIALLRGGAGGQELSTAVSFELSINNRRMTDEARRLLSLLGVLPDGIAHDDLDTVLPGIGQQAATTLRMVGLAFEEQARLRILQPIRDHVQAKHAPRPDDLARAVTHYSALAETHGWQVGRPRNAMARNLVLGERGNLEVMVSHGPHEGGPRPAIHAPETTGGTTPYAGIRSPSVYDLFHASREALLNGMVAVGSGDGELIGWTHFLHEYRAGQRVERPTAIGTCYGLKSMLLLDAIDPRFRQHRVVETLWQLQVPGGGWSARTQSLVGRPEVTAWIISALRQAGSDEERMATAVQRCIELLDPEVDPVGWERTLVVATALSVLALLAPAKSFSTRLRESLLSGMIRDPEHGLRCWGERLADGAIEEGVGPSVPHTARAIIALGRADDTDHGTDRAIAEAVRWLIAKHDFANQTEHIRRELPDFRSESLVVRHFTAAWVARALMSAEEKGFEGSGELVREAVEFVHQRQRDGVWEWDNQEKPMWMTYQGIATLRLHALRTSRLSA